MTKQGDFLIYCVETYKNAKHLTGRQVAELFTRYDVWVYVYSCFEALHTTGANYIVEDIDLYMPLSASWTGLTGGGTICCPWPGCTSRRKRWRKASCRWPSPDFWMTTPM